MDQMWPAEPLHLALHGSGNLVPGEQWPLIQTPSCEFQIPEPQALCMWSWLGQAMKPSPVGPGQALPLCITTRMHPHPPVGPGWGLAMLTSPHGLRVGWPTSSSLPQGWVGAWPYHLSCRPWPCPLPSQCGWATSPSSHGNGLGPDHAPSPAEPGHIPFLLHGGPLLSPVKLFSPAGLQWGQSAPSSTPCRHWIWNTSLNLAHREEWALPVGPTGPNG